jgi:hypothetical protein
MRIAVVASRVTMLPQHSSRPSATTEATSRSSVATSGKAKSRGLATSAAPCERPTVLRLARFLAGFLASKSSRTASSRTSTRAEIVFFTVDDPNSTSHRSMARSMSPAVSMPTGRCPTAGRTLSRNPAEYGSRVDVGSIERDQRSPIASTYSRRVWPGSTPVLAASSFSSSHCCAASAESKLSLTSSRLFVAGSVHRARARCFIPR